MHHAGEVSLRNVILNTTAKAALASEFLHFHHRYHTVILDVSNTDLTPHGVLLVLKRIQTMTTLRVLLTENITLTREAFFELQRHR